MRRRLPPLPAPALLGTALVVALLSAWTGPVAAGAAGAPTVRTVIGPRQLESPGGLALDTAGDLFVADTGHCRVLVVPAQSAFRYGRQLQAGRVVTVAGGSCTGAHAMGRPSGLAVDLHGDLYVAEATAQRVQEIRADGTAGLFTVAGSGLDQPTSVAVDGSGDVFIADTAHCRVVALPARDTMLFGQVVRAGQLSTV
ncbi:MAG TPA: NHL repeat-containing protein, partial [Acidimicrobiales bacterium]|nr:NHL repeat-containing protein [Acidimicrobiales bacterium]